LLQRVVHDGGDPSPVLDHAFATNGWSSWPSRPHHPGDPDDALITPESVWESSWSYWFRATDAGWILEVREGLGADEMAGAPLHRFARTSVARAALGVSSVDTTSLPPPSALFERTAKPERVGPLLALIHVLGLERAVHVGVSIWPSAWERHLRLPGFVFSLPSTGFAGACFVVGESSHPMPDAASVAAMHPELFDELTGGLAGAPSIEDMDWLRLFEALFEEGIPLDGPVALPQPDRFDPAPEQDLIQRLLERFGDVQALEAELNRVVATLRQGQDIEVLVDAGAIQCVRWRKVVAEVIDPDLQIALSEANDLSDTFQVGDDHGQVVSDLLPEVVQHLGS